MEVFSKPLEMIETEVTTDETGDQMASNCLGTTDY